MSRRSQGNDRGSAADRADIGFLTVTCSRCGRQLLKYSYLYDDLENLEHDHWTPANLAVTPTATGPALRLSCDCGAHHVVTRAGLRRAALPGSSRKVAL